MARLLVIRPDATLLEALARDRGLQAHTVETTGGNLEALRIARERVVDVAITDPTLPFSEDLAFVEEVHALRPAARVIVLAPAATQEDLISALRTRVFACFLPPFEYSEIVSMARGALDESGEPDSIELISGLPNWLTVRVSCKLLTAERLVRFMSELQSPPNASLPERERDLLLTAFREMLLNAMEHGAGFDADKVIEVTAARTKRTIAYYFRDPGDGFDRTDLSHAADSATPEAIVASAERRMELGMRPGGFGMLIVRQIVDELAYNERGNEVLMIKHLT